MGVDTSFAGFDLGDFDFFTGEGLGRVMDFQVVAGVGTVSEGGVGDTIDLAD